MTGRSPARLLAPAALVVAAVALFAIFASGGGESATDPSSTATDAAATATATVTPEKPRSKTSSGKTYVVEPGDTPSAIAASLDIELDALLAANPGVEADALTVGQELELP